MRSKDALLYVILFSVVDVFIPVPILGLVLVYVLMTRPPWFLDLVKDVYQIR